MEDSESAEVSTQPHEEGAHQQDEHQHQQVDETANAHHSYSIYEPHYQQMHPLIYYEEPIHHHHHHLNHHLSHNHHHQHHPHILAQNWEPEHYVHMPMMIPYGDTSEREYCQSNEQQIQANEIIITSSHPNVSDVTMNQQALADTEAKGEQVLSEAQETKVDPSVGEHNHQENQIVIGLEVAEEPNTTTATATTTARQSIRTRRANGGTRSSGSAHRTRSRNRNTLSPGVTSSPGTNRELHNEIERRRRSRIKYCCEILRGKIPGLNDKTDKATVLEHTVKFINHLVSCPEFKCNCEIWNWTE